MKRSDIKPMPEYYDRYINLAEDIELAEAFRQSLHVIDALDIDMLTKIGSKVYAPGKWTIKDIIQHISDTERVFSYRALRFARNDQTALPGFDQDLFAANTTANQRSPDDLIHELEIVRQSTISLFNSFDEIQLLRKGKCWKSELSVLAIGFNIIGHQQHHFTIIAERYLPLA
jgi:DinB superfamily